MLSPWLWGHCDSLWDTKEIRDKHLKRACKQSFVYFGTNRKLCLHYYTQILLAGCLKECNTCVTDFSHSNINTAHAGKDGEQGRYSSISGKSKNLNSHNGNSFGSCQKIGNQSASRHRYPKDKDTKDNQKILWKGPLLNHIHWSFIHNSQNLETT